MLKTQYAGLELKNPIIAASSGLTDNVEKIVALEKAGVGAVVLKSLFEEQMFALGGELLFKERLSRGLRLSAKYRQSPRSGKIPHVDTRSPESGIDTGNSQYQLLRRR